MPRSSNGGAIAWALLAGAVSAVGAAVAAEVRPGISGNGHLHEPHARAAESVDSETDAARFRLREGTRLKDCTGRFRQNGDSLTFLDADGREIGGLPNLNLERVLRVLKSVEEPESISWNVSGRITEFSGRNFLLISRAVYKSAAPPPVPESVE